MKVHSYFMDSGTLYIAFHPRWLSQKISQKKFSLLILQKLIPMCHGQLFKLQCWLC